MKTKDPHDIRKSQIEDQLTSAAEDRAQIATFGKVCYEAGRTANRWGAGGQQPWSKLSEDAQVVWVNRARAVLEEAKRVGWLIP